MARTAATTAGEVPTDVLEERLIDAEYKIWKKNTPYLYDFVMTHSLEWPSLTCQWLPHVRPGASSQPGGVAAVDHFLLLGTHTTGEQNHLMMASCTLPKDDAVVDNPEHSSSSEGGGGGGSSTKEPAVPSPRYDEEKKEVGGFGHANSNIGKIEIRVKVKHEGEVNRARYMPQNHFIIASRGPQPEVYIFDLSKHPSVPPEQSVVSPQGVCIGHKEEGYGMVWSPHKEGMLLTGSGDSTVKLWNVDVAISGKSSPGTQISALSTFTAHTKTVEDVDWHSKDPNMVGSVGDDKLIALWDDRKPGAPIHKKENAHDGDINCFVFNPINEHIFATGSADKKIGIWDVRNLSSRLHTLESHSDQIYMLQWAPFNESILGSCSSDRRVAVWDLSCIGKEQDPEDAEDGPPELLFLHGGHTSKVSDFTWNTNENWTVASVSEDNVLQVWNMAEEIYAENEDDGSAGEGEDGLLGDDELED